MVYGARAINNFIESVAVNIALAQTMASLTFIRRKGFPIFSRARGISIEIPPLSQFAAPPINGPEARASVIAPAGDCAWPFPVQICNGRQKAVHAVAVLVSPFRINLVARRI